MKVDTQDVPIASGAVPFTYKPFDHSQINVVSKEFYVSAMAALDVANIPFLVGGAYAFSHYSNIDRHTKDFDIFVRKEDAGKILEVLGKNLKCKVDRTFHWLYKAILGADFIDIIFSSGNGIAVVDDTWFEKAPRRKVLGVNALLVPAEEMIWSKGFIMERERFDGADIAHILLGWSDKMNWERLISRFGTHWRVLFSHLVLFGYVYPHERDSIPAWVMSTLTQQLLAEQMSQSLSSSLPILPSISPAPESCPKMSHPLSSSTSSITRVCQGTLLSRQQYLKDVAEWAYEDARTRSCDGMTPLMSDAEVAHWTAAAFNHGSASN